VNSSPSIREAETACGVDAAGRIVERAAVLAGERPARRRVVAVQARTQ
jgi:ribosomal protein S6--L-glutamate ligase